MDHLPEFAQFVPAGAQTEQCQMAQGLPLGQLAFVDQMPAQFALDFFEFLVNRVSLVHEFVYSFSHDLRCAISMAGRNDRGLCYFVGLLSRATLRLPTGLRGVLRRLAAYRA